MRVLDLFCGAGGAAKGLHRVWPKAAILGVDIEPQPNYPFEFVQADAMTFPLVNCAFIWASPPCQAYTMLRGLGKQSHRPKPRYIYALRRRLQDTGCPFLIENVVGAPLIKPITLCGQFFGLAVRRHRLFESNFRIAQVDCRDSHKPRPIAVYGDHPQQPGDKTYRCNRARSLEEGQKAMGIDWMNWRELTQAIPPAYSEYIAKQLNLEVCR